MKSKVTYSLKLLTTLTQNDKQAEDIKGIKEQIKKTKHPAQLFKLYGDLGDLYSTGENFEAAIQAFQEYIKFSDDCNKALGYSKLGVAYLLNGEELESESGIKYMTSIENFKNSYNALKNAWKYVEKCEEQDNIESKNLQLQVLINWGIIRFKLGRLTSAIQCLQKAVRIARDLGDKDSEQRAYINLGIIYLEKNDYSNAIMFYKMDFNIASENNDEYAMANSLWDLGTVELRLGTLKMARSYFERSKVLKKKLKIPMTREEITILNETVDISHLEESEHDSMEKDCSYVFPTEEEEIMSSISDDSGFEDFLSQGKLSSNVGSNLNDPKTGRVFNLNIQLELPMGLFCSEELEKCTLLIPCRDRTVKEVKCLLEERLKSKYHILVRIERIKTTVGSELCDEDIVSNILKNDVTVTAEIRDITPLPPSEKYHLITSQKDFSSSIFNKLQLGEKNQLNFDFSHTVIDSHLNRNYYPLENVISSINFTKLNYLNLSYNNIDDAQLGSIAKSLSNCQLRKWDLCGNAITSKGLTILTSVLRDSMNLHQYLNELDISYNLLHDSTLMEVVDLCESLPSISALTLVCCSITFFKAEVKLSSPSALRLKCINLSNNPLSGTGFKMFLEWLYLSSGECINQVDLSMLSLPSDVWIQLSRFSSLTRLILKDTDIGGETFISKLSSFWNLQHLDLSHCYLSVQECVLVFTECCQLKNLSHIILMGIPLNCHVVREWCNFLSNFNIISWEVLDLAMTALQFKDVEILLTILKDKFKAESMIVRFSIDCEISFLQRLCSQWELTIEDVFGESIEVVSHLFLFLKEIAY